MPPGRHVTTRFCTDLDAESDHIFDVILGRISIVKKGNILKVYLLDDIYDFGGYEGKPLLQQLSGSAPNQTCSTHLSPSIE